MTPGYLVLTQWRNYSRANGGSAQKLFICLNQNLPFELTILILLKFSYS